MNELTQPLKRFLKRVEKESQITGRLGNPEDGSLFAENDDGSLNKNYVWVRIDAHGSESQSLRIVRCRKVNPSFDSRVILRQAARDGELEVVEEDPVEALEMFGERSTNTPVHAWSHALLSSDPMYIEAFQFMPLLAHPNSPMDLNVYVEQYSYTFEGTNKVWTPDVVGLSALVPANPNEQIAVVISLDPSTNTMNVTAADDPIESGVIDFRNMPFEASDLTAIDTGSDIRIAGVRLYYGQTMITLFDFIEDLRPFAGPSGSGGSGTPADTVEDETAYGLTADAGIATEYSRGDHTHGSVGHDDHANLTNVTSDQHHARSHDHSNSSDGSTLTPAVLNIPSSATPAQTAEGQAVWESDADQLTIGDGASRKVMANNDLANLGTTAINADLLFGADNTLDIGSTSAMPAEIWSYLLALKERSAPSTPPTDRGFAYLDTIGQLRLMDDLGQDKTMHSGSQAPRVQVVAASTTPTSGFAFTVKQNEMGSNGWIYYDLWLVISNTGSTSVSCTFTVSFGGVTLHTFGSNATGTATPRYHVIHLVGVIANIAGASSQKAVIVFDGSATALQDTAALSSARNDLIGIKTATVDTSSADRVFDVTGTLNTGTNSLLERVSGFVIVCPN